MENNKNLEELTEEVSSLLLDCIDLLEICYEMYGEKRREGFLINLLQKNINTAFDYIEASRNLISKPN